MLLLFFVLALILVSIRLVNADVLCPSDNVWSSTGCVCDHSPNSTLGYGQVIIGGAFPSIISCNNIGDGLCPEDFTDPVSGLTANCSSCPDPDCTVNNSLNVGYVAGCVVDGNGIGISKVTITSHPVKTNASASLESSTVTDDYGCYNSTAFISGTYLFSASKNGYDTELLQATVIRGKLPGTTLNFKLLNGTCNSDCTNSYNNCNAACDGVTFGSGATATKCSFFNAATKAACNNIQKGVNVSLEGYPGNNATYKYFVECCDKTPVAQRYVKALAEVREPAIKNLVKTEKIARLDYQPIRVVIAYWSKP